MNTLLKLIAGNIACIAFLLFTIWCLKNNHIGFAIVGIIFSIFSATILTTEKINNDNCTGTKIE